MDQSAKSPETGDRNPSGPQRASADQVGAFTEIAPGIHRCVAEPDTVTIGLVAGSRGAVLIDTGSSPEQGARLRELAEQATGVPVVGAVITHGHRDHWFGLSAFADVTIWGHESLAEDPGTDVLEQATALGLTRDDLAAPNKPLSMAAAVDLGGVRLEMLFLGRAHTSSDLMVLAYSGDSLRPSAIFAGDVVESAPASGESVWFGPDSSPETWGSSLDALTSLLTDEVQVVPGHGPVVDKQFVLDQRARIMSVPFETERLINDGIGFDQAQAKGEWMLPWPNIEAGVRIGYAELEARGIVPRTRLPLTQHDLD